METRPTQKYNQSYTLNFNLYEVDGVDMRTDATFAAGDVVIMQDEGAEANTTNLPTDEGTGYSLVLTAAEMSAARIVIYIVDQTATKVWLDVAIAIETYGNASAQHAMDFDDSVRAGLTALPNAAADAAGGLPISDAGGLDLDTILDVAISTRLAPTVASRTLDVTSTGAAGIDWGNVENPTTSLDLSATSIQLVDTATDVTNQVTADVTAISGDTTAANNLELDYDGTGYNKSNSTIGTCTTNSDMRGTDNAALATDLATVDTNVDAILVDTGTTIPNTLADIEGASFDTATDSLQAIRDRGDAAWTTGAGGTPPQLLQSTTIATLASQTSFTLTAGSPDDNAYNGAIAVLTDQTTSEQKAVGDISDYVGSTRTVTLSADPGIFTVAVGDTIEIIAALGSGGDATAANQATIISDIAALNDVAATDIVSNGAITTLSGAVVNVDTVDTCTTNTDMRGTDSAALATDLATVDTNVDAILVDTGTTIPNQISGLNDVAATDIVSNGAITTLSGAVVNVDTVDTCTANTDMRGTDNAALATDLATVDTNVDAILVDTGTDIPAQITALNDISVSDILTTQMTESYAADGTAPTLAQALFLIQQNIGDFSISGTTITVRELDGATTAATYTLDDGTSPTSKTRAT